MNKVLKSKNVILMVSTVFAVIIVIGGLYFYQNNEKEQIQLSVNTNGVNNISPVEFNKIAKDPNTFILDVHTPKQTHIPGTDAFMPYTEIENNLDKLPEDKDTPLLVYCRSGGMSKIATEELVSLGYKNVYDLEGGVNAYKDSNVLVAITPENKDLGTVIYGDVEKTTFTLTNFTKKPLKIIRVSTSCGCTSADVDKKELDPYESTDVNVSFDPAVHKDDTDLGELTRTIYIDTDNPNYSQLTANINANVIKN